MTGCAVCDAADVLMRAQDQMTQLGRAGAPLRTADLDRLRTADQHWSQVREQRHTCYRLAPEVAA